MQEALLLGSCLPPVLVTQLGEFVGPNPGTPSNVSLEVLVPRSRTVPPEDSAAVPLKCKLWFVPDNFGIFMPIDKQENKSPSWQG